MNKFGIGILALVFSISHSSFANTWSVWNDAQGETFLGYLTQSQIEQVRNKGSLETEKPEVRAELPESAHIEIVESQLLPNPKAQGYRSFQNDSDSDQNFDVSVFASFDEAWEGFKKKFKNTRSSCQNCIRRVLVKLGDSSPSPQTQNSIEKGKILSGNELHLRLKRQTSQSALKAVTMTFSIGALLTEGFLINELSEWSKGLSPKLAIAINSTAPVVVWGTWQVLGSPLVNRASSYVTRASFQIETILEHTLVPDGFRSRADRTWAQYYGLFSENEQIVIDLARDADEELIKTMTMVTGIQFFNTEKRKIKEFSKQLGICLFKLGILYPFIDLEEPVFLLATRGKTIFQLAANSVNNVDKLRKKIFKNYLSFVNLNFKDDKKRNLMIERGQRALDLFLKEDVSDSSSDEDEV